MRENVVKAIAPTENNLAIDFQTKWLTDYTEFVFCLFSKFEKKGLHRNQKERPTYHYYFSREKETLSNQKHSGQNYIINIIREHEMLQIRLGMVKI